MTLIGNNGEGEPIPLTDFNGPQWSSIFIQPGATGLDMPPFGLFSDESPNLDGSIYRSARATAREVMIPVYLHGYDRESINNLKRKLFQALNPKRGYCLIRFTEGVNRVRQLTAYYKGGMEGSESVDASGFRWAKFGLTFSAMDPWFYPTRAQSTRWDFGAGEAFLSASRAFIPVQLAAGVMGVPEDDITISNAGDIEAWPIWKLSGPIKSFSLRGPEGDLIKASPPEDGSDLVPLGRTLTIDTRPGRKTVKDNTGLNYWATLDTNPQFWSVEPGETNAKVSVVAGTSNASVVLSFYPRYASFV
ncbi:phage tail domain-containing protein [Streptomyces sp. H27-H5]|uniref:phage tail domain-containing protein n=1 Tax=Streptomyces sp. H27-H5 TaxID=2996460 RepID=UPI00226EC188|nr:phage tail domain-containing protein [Streptomyces sp. H27-H5]MCY0962732.1 phage tail family protein [Streptomyces sp. H27-H5]